MKLAGFAILVSYAVIAISLVGAILSWLSRDWTGGGACVIAAAIASGCLLNAVTRE